MTIADKILRAKDDYDAVYSAGYEKGKAEGGGGGSYDQGYAAGKQSERDLFWDNFQQNGNCHNYDSAFRGDFFNDAIYNPTYPIIASDTYGASYMYMNNKRLTDTKVTVSVPGLGNGMVFYQASRLKRIPTLEISDKTTFSNWFAGCSALEEMNVVGEIAQNDFDVRWSTKLSRDSIIGVVNALSPTTTGLTVTLSKAAVENAFAPINITPFNESSFDEITNNGDGTATLTKAPTEDINYVLNDDIKLSRGSYELILQLSHLDLDGDGVLLKVTEDGQTIANADMFNHSEGAGVIFDIEKDEATVSLSVYIKGNLGWSEEPLMITPQIMPAGNWESLKATKPNWTIALA